MGFLFHKPKAVTQVQQFQGIPVNNSEDGTVIPVYIGPNKVPFKLIWAGDWKNTPVTTPGSSQGGKGLGGGSSSATTTNDYTEALISLLGYGTIDHLDSIFGSNGRIGVTQVSTNYTIPGGGGFLDINDTNFSGDYGVGMQATYSQVVNDF